MAGAYQQERALELFVGHAEKPLQNTVLAVGDELEMLVRDCAGCLQARCFLVVLMQLQKHALTDGARTDAGGVEALHKLDALLDLLGSHGDVGRERSTDRLDVVDQIPVVIDRIDDGLTDRECLRIDILELQLPQQVLLQVLAGTVCILEIDLRVGRPRRIRWAHALRIVPVGNLRRVELDFLYFLDFLGRLIRVVFRARLLRNIELLGLEHDVLVERLLNLGAQVHDRQLQQANRLLQLRSHRQLLRETELQRWL